MSPTTENNDKPTRTEAADRTSRLSQNRWLQ